MRRSYLLLVCAGLAVLRPLPAAAQAPAGAPPPAEADSTSLLGTFVRDATTLTALPWQRDALGLSTEQVMALQSIAEGRGRMIRDLYEEIRMLFENVARLDRPVDAHEALALFYDLAAHKVEALLAFHDAAGEMLAVLTPAQRAQWEAALEAAARAQGDP
jgi:hypothetical protein